MLSNRIVSCFHYLFVNNFFDLFFIILIIIPNPFLPSSSAFRTRASLNNIFPCERTLKLIWVLMLSAINVAMSFSRYSFIHRMKWVVGIIHSTFKCDSVRRIIINYDRKRYEGTQRHTNKLAGNRCLIWVVKRKLESIHLENRNVKHFHGNNETNNSSESFAIESNLLRMGDSAFQP